jgi:hypothetical protein
MFTSETVESGGTFLLQNANSAGGTMVLSGGTFIISGADNAANNTVLSGGTLDLDSPKAVIGGSLTFASGTDSDLEVSVIADSGMGDLATASGFTSGDRVDITALTESSVTLSKVISGGNTVAEVVSGGSVVESFTFAGTAISGRRRDRVQCRRRAVRLDHVGDDLDRAGHAHGNGRQHASCVERRQRLGCDHRQRHFSHRQRRR